MDLFQLPLRELWDQLITDTKIGLAAEIASKKPIPTVPLPQLTQRLKTAVSATNIFPFMLIIYLFALWDAPDLLPILFGPVVVQILVNIYQFDKRFKEASIDLHRGRVIRHKENKSTQVLEHAVLQLGDLIILKPGDILGADVLIIRANNLWINKSMVVEVDSFDPVEVNDDSSQYLQRSNIGLCSTYVMKGSGLGIVIATGADVYFQPIVYGPSLVHVTGPVKRLMGRWGLISALLLLLSMIFRFFYNTHLLVVLAIMFSHLGSGTIQIVDAYYREIGSLLPGKVKNPAAIYALGHYIEALVVDVHSISDLQYKLSKVLYGDSSYVGKLREALQKDLITLFGTIYDKAVLASNFKAGEDCKVDRFLPLFKGNVESVILNGENGKHYTLQYGELSELDGVTLPPELSGQDLSTPCLGIALRNEDQTFELKWVVEMSPQLAVNKEDIEVLSTAEKLGFGVIVVSDKGWEITTAMLKAGGYVLQNTFENSFPECFGAAKFELTLLWYTSVQDLHTSLQELSKERNCALLTCNSSYTVIKKGMTIVNRPTDLNQVHADYVVDSKDIPESVILAREWAPSVRSGISTYAAFQLSIAACAVLGYRYGVTSEVVLMANMGLWLQVPKTCVFSPAQIAVVIVWSLLVQGWSCGEDTIGCWVVTAVLQGFAGIVAGSEKRVNFTALSFLAVKIIALQYIFLGQGFLIPNSTSLLISLAITRLKRHRGHN